MKKVNSTRDLPKWFDLKNYNFLAELLIEEIKFQINVRNILLRTFDHYEAEKSTVLKDESFNQRWMEITKGDVIVKETSVCNQLHNEELILPSTPAISGLKSITAYFHSQNLLRKELIKIEDKSTIIHNDILLGDYDLVLKKFNLGGIVDGAVVNINLEYFSNKEILADIEKLLPLWRSKLDTPEPEGIAYAKVLDYSKVVAYSIIPLLDLMIWEKLNDTKIPLKVMAVALFPYGEKGENELKQTIIPLAVKMMSINYRQV